MEKFNFDQQDTCDSGAMSFAFPRSRRLLCTKDFKDVFDKSSFRASHKCVLVLARANEKKYARLGLVFGKKSVRRSVDRNRLKRITREQFRLQNSLISGIDIIIMAREGLAKLNNKTFAALIGELFENIKQQQLRKQKE